MDMSATVFLVVGRNEDARAGEDPASSNHHHRGLRRLQWPPPILPPCRA